MDKEQFKAQLLQLAELLRNGLKDFKEWDSVSDWSRTVNASDKVFVSFSPGEHASALTITFADKGVTELAPPDLGEETKPTYLQPSDQRSDLEGRIRRLLARLEMFGGWHRDGELLKVVNLHGVEVQRVVRPDGSILVTISPPKGAPRNPGE